jgi:hypothetical protein
VEAKGWQAFYATLLMERSKFGLNELLGSFFGQLAAEQSGLATTKGFCRQ